MNRKVVCAKCDSGFIKKGQEYVCERIIGIHYYLEGYGWYNQDNFKSLSDIREDKINELLRE